MKNKLLLLTLIFVIHSFTSVSFAQKIKYLGFYGGPSFPVGDFADINSSYGAPATTGFNFSIMFNGTQWDNFGISSMLFGQIMPVDEKEITNTIQNSSIQITAKNWVYGGALVGGYGYFPINNGPVGVEAMLMMGGLYTQFPDVSVNETEILSGGVAGSFAYLVGAGINYSVSKSVCLILDLNYLGSSPEYQTISAGTIGINVSGKKSQTINTINLSLGVGFIF